MNVTDIQLKNAIADHEKRCHQSAASGCYQSSATPQERIDAALDAVLLASGSALKNYTLPNSLERMREAMRKIMSDSYIAGSNAAHRILMGQD
jgi:hypothetical protein